MNISAKLVHYKLKSSGYNQNRDLSSNNLNFFNMLEVMKVKEIKDSRYFLKILGHDLNRISIK